MAVEEESFGGWRMAWRELKEHGIDPYSDFADLSFGGTHDAVVYAVQEGRVDAGTVRTDALKRMAREGKIHLEDFYIFYENRSACEEMPFLYSTRSYPEWPFARVKHTSGELAEKVAAALIGMSPDTPAARAARCTGWTIPLNYQTVHECLKYLRVGPYEDYGKVTFQDMLRQYWAWLLGLTVSVTIIVFFAFRAIRLNRILQESRGRFRLAASCAADLIYEWDIATDHLEWYGDIDIALGYEPGELPRTIAAWSKRIHPDDQKQVAESVTHHRDSGEPLYIEYRIRRKDGNELYWVGRGVAVLGKNGKPCKSIGTCTDITERKQAEKALVFERAQLLSIFDSIDEVIYIADPNTYEILYVNRAVQDVFQKELIGGICYREFQGLDSPCEFCTNEIILKQKPAPHRWEYHNPTLDRDFAIVDRIIKWPDGRDVRFEIAVDITERKQAEEETHKFKTISDNASHGVAIADVSGNITYINDCFAEMHGYKPEELIGRNLSIFHNEEQMESVKKINGELVEKGSYTTLEVWHKHRDGSVFPTLMNGVGLRDEEGNVAFIAATAINITESKRMQKFAERAQKMEAAGRVAGQIAHDFNNLLAPMIAYPELIREELPEDSPIHEFINDMENAAIQIAEINQQLLTLGRRGHYNIAPMNLSKTIERSLRQIHSLPEKLIINRDLAPDLMNITGGESQIIRVLSNIIANACDAMQDDGKLTIRTENYYLDKSSDKWGEIPKGEYVKLTISDTGDGIPADVLPKIFEPYFTTKKSDPKRGSGLGLSVVHAVIEDHNGYINCESTPGEGTSFYIYLPVTREDIKVGPAEHIRSGDEYVLVVDDDNRQRTVTLSLLEKLGYTVEQAESGEKAIEHIRSKSPDLLLLDMIMPGGIDGTETYRRALEIDPSLKAIFVSGYAESDRVREGLELGVGAFIKKPLTLRSIALAVRKELDREVMVAVH